MGEMMVKNQSNFINLLSARQTEDVFPMVADVQRWGVMNSSSSEDELGVDETMSSASSLEENSSSSGSLVSNSSAEDFQDDASSSFQAVSPAAPRLSRGPLYELSELMNELPVKRGLSKHFQGKSQSFTSLSNVHALEDLAKRENPYKKKQMMMKSCKSYACGLDNSKSFATNNSSKIISKKGGNKGGSFSSLVGSKRNGFMSCSISPPILE